MRRTVFSCAGLIILLFALALLCLSCNRSHTSDGNGTESGTSRNYENPYLTSETEPTIPPKTTESETKPETPSEETTTSPYFHPEKPSGESGGSLGVGSDTGDFSQLYPIGR